MGKLDGKVALISGGTTGIGAATARLFLAQGASVVVTGSSERSVSAAAKEVPGALALVSDAGDVAASKTLVDQVVRTHGRIDVLVVNAGVAGFKPMAEVDEAFFDRQFDINVKGAYFLMKHVAPVMADGGSIVLTGSVAGATGGLPGGTVYGATKAALRALGRSVAKELLPRGIRVNTVSPGPIGTPLIDKDFTPDQRDAFVSGSRTRIPLGRMGEPEEVARAILYLAADATYTTGAELSVDGGLAEL